MRLEEIEALLQRQPCPLLRLHLTGGQVFEIAGPDDAVMDRHKAEILLPPQDGKQREAVVSLLHVVWVEVVSD
jgi:hypothetical protein